MKNAKNVFKYINVNKYRRVRNRILLPNTFFETKEFRRIYLQEFT